MAASIDNVNDMQDSACDMGGRDLGPPVFFIITKKTLSVLLVSRPERATIRQHTRTRTHSFGFRPVRHLNTIGVTCDIESSVRADNKAAL